MADVVCERPGSGTRFTVPGSNSSTLQFHENFLPAGEFLFGVTVLRGNRMANEIIYIKTVIPDDSLQLRTVSIRTKQVSLKTLPQQRLVLKGFVDGVNELGGRSLSVAWSDEPNSAVLVANTTSPYFALSFLDFLRTDEKKNPSIVQIY